MINAYIFFHIFHYEIVSGRRCNNDACFTTCAWKCHVNATARRFDILSSSFTLRKCNRPFEPYATVYFLLSYRCLRSTRLCKQTVSLLQTVRPSKRIAFLPLMRNTLWRENVIFDIAYAGSRDSNCGARRQRYVLSFFFLPPPPRISSAVFPEYLFITHGLSTAWKKKLRDRAIRTQIRSFPA